MTSNSEYPRYPDTYDPARKKPSPDEQYAGRVVTPPVIEFTGRRGALFKLSLINAILTILTGGLYRFWAKTWVRRFFWNNIRINGEPLEYTGTPVELFVGFLIVLTFLIPIFALYEGGSYLIYAAPAWAEYTLEVTYLLTLLAFIHMAVYRMWRFRLSRTSWRAIRFGLDGSTWDYLKIAMGWSLLTVLTLGLSYPAMRVATWRYRVRHMRFGNTRFDFNGSAKSIMGLWLAIYGLPLAAMLAAVALHFDTFVAAWESSGDYTSATIKYSFDEPLFGGGLALFMLFFIWYRVREARLMLSGICWSSARLKTKIHLGTISAVLAIYAVVWVGLATILIAAAFAIVFLLGVTNKAEAFQIGTMVGVGITMLMFFIMGPVITQMVIRFEFVRHVCAVSNLTNTETFETALQSTHQTPEFGEGMADALDVGAL